MATKTDPNNKEVIKKLEEIKSTLQKETSADHSHGDIPTGLGIGLSTPKKKESTSLEKGILQKQGESKVNKSDSFKILHSSSCENEKKQQFQVKDPMDTQFNSSENETASLNGKMDYEHVNKDVEDNSNNEEDKGSSTLTNMEYEEYSEIREHNYPTVFSKKEMNEAMEDTRECLSTSESSSSITEDVDMISGSCNNEEVKSLNSAEPIYRFNNRKRQGSKLTISSDNYYLLTQGKSLKFYNAKLGSVMEVRISNKADEQVTEKGEIQSRERVGPMHGGNQSSFQKVKQVKQDSPEDVHSQVGSCVTSDDDRQNSIEDGAVSSPSTMVFSTNPNLRARKKIYDIKTHASSKTPLKSNKRRKVQSKKIVPFSPDNFCCGQSVRRENAIISFQWTSIIIQGKNWLPMAIGLVRVMNVFLIVLLIVI